MNSRAEFIIADNAPEDTVGSLNSTTVSYLGCITVEKAPNNSSHDFISTMRPFNSTEPIQSSTKALPACETRASVERSMGYSCAEASERTAVGGYCGQ